MTFVTADTVADLTGFTGAAAFLAARRRLERETGFPPPMPTCLRPMKWRRDAVEAWVSLQGQTTQPGPVYAGTNVILLEEARRG